MAFYGLPAHGITMEGSLGDFCNQGPQRTMKVTPGFGEVMPFTCIDGWNVPHVMVCSKSQELSGPPLPPGVTVRGPLSARLNYRANVTLQATPGLTEIQLVPVPDRKGQFFGLQGVMAKGDPSARLTLGMSLGPFYSGTGSLLPNEVSWEWEATATWWACPGGLNTGATNEWSHADLQIQGRYSDWVLAAAMKAIYNHDPAGLTYQLGGP